MSKTMNPAEADGENLGIVKFGPGGAAALVDIMDRVVAAGRLKDWAPRAFAEFAQSHPLHAIGTRGLPWIEIDFPEDYRRAAEHVLPEIEADMRAYPRLISAGGWDGRTERRAARTDRRTAAFFDRRTSAALLADAS
jgi:hypothetical protein